MSNQAPQKQTSLLQRDKCCCCKQFCFGQHDNKRQKKVINNAVVVCFDNSYSINMYLLWFCICAVPESKWLGWASHSTWIEKKIHVL